MPTAGLGPCHSCSIGERLCQAQQEEAGVGWNVLLPGEIGGGCFPPEC